MNSRKPAVEVRNIVKEFYLPQHKSNSLKENITQIFKKKAKGGTNFLALKGLSFDVEQGDFFGILGKNGSGKSTLLKIISNIYQPTSGSVKQRGKIVSFIELGVGFKPQLTGRHNVFLNGALLGFSRSEMESMYDEIVAFAELEDFMDQKLKNFSSGMKVRLAFSLAIRAKADILILDEVLAVGDASFQNKCNDYFKTLRKNQKTVILVTHSMANVRRYCNKAVVIDDGKIVYEGDAHNATKAYLNLFGKNPSSPNVEHGKKSTTSLDKKVLIDDVTTLCTHDKIEVDIKLRSKLKQDNIKLAVRILNSQKKTVAGANTQSVAEPKVLSFAENETISVKFTFDNILGDGEFSVDIVTGPVVVTGVYHDSVNDVAGFTNYRLEGHYPVVAPASIEVYKL